MALLFCNTCNAVRDFKSIELQMICTHCSSTDYSCTQDATQAQLVNHISPTCIVVDIDTTE